MPDDWENTIIESLSKEVICGKTPSTKRTEYYGNDIPFITIPDMHGNTYIVQTERALSILGAASQNGKTLPPNSICVSCIGTAGLVSLVATESQTNQQINSIIPQEKVSAYYIYLLMQSLAKTIQNLGSGGSTICNLNKGHFSNIEIILPSNQVMREFDSAVAPMFEMIKQNQLQNISLSNIRDAFLPRLMTGEIDVSEMDI